MDSSFVTVNNAQSIPLTVLGLSEDCHSCDPEILGIVNPNTNSTYSVNGQYPYTLYFKSNVTFEHSDTFGDQGEYNFVVNYTGVQSSILRDPKNTWLPLLIFFLVLGVAAVVIPYLVRLVDAFLNWVFSDDSSKESGEKKPMKIRLRSLDSFRGLSLCIMIFVNYGGGGYWFFAHSTWDGLTVADLVFPWFIFMMGVSLALAQDAHARRNERTRVVVWRAFRRSCSMFWLGLFLATNQENGVKFTSWRIPGVLQRFGISFFANAMVLHFVPTSSTSSEPEAGHLNAVTSTQGVESQTEQTSSPSMFSLANVREIVAYKWQWLAMLFIHFMWYIITFAIPIPGCPRGYLGAGGRADGGKYQNCTGGMARYIDVEFLTLNHIYQTPTCRLAYSTGAYDPEGTLGSLNSIFLCFLGVHAGRILLKYKDPWDRIRRLATCCLILCLLGGSLCKFQKYDGPIPINKNLWSSSFIYVMSGTGCGMLALTYYVVDVREWWSGAPFIFPGMNSIVVYFASETYGSYFPMAFYTKQSHWLALTSQGLGVSTFIFMAYILYRRKTFIAL